VVASVEGGLDSLTRSFGVSLRAKEGAPWLRPGVYVEVRVALAQGERLSVPADVAGDSTDAIPAPQEVTTDGTDKSSVA